MIRPLATLLFATSALVPVAVQAQELPSAGTVAAGSAQIAAPTPGAMTITQGSDRAIINWQSFSIGEGGRVDIFQPDAGSVLLNRVTGDTGSRIAGALNANGQVYVVNPNGILITGTGSVNAAGFVASTLGISDDRFMRGDIVVSGQGGSVRNEGRISIVKGGYAALIGGKVDNAGLIVAPLGRVGLGSGTRATLDLNGDEFLQVALPAAGEGGVAMSGRIAADGGSVLLTAASAVNAARHTVNLSGVIEARGVTGRNGSVVLTGPDIALTGAAIDVSGASGGGTVKIGGDYMGGGTLPRAATLTVDAESHIRADATDAGDGGNIILWSDKATHFAGTISARGAGVGNGGDAEVSSKGLLGYTGHADLRGTVFGTLLLDPYNVIISKAPDANTPGFVPTGNDSIINSTTLQNALATANVTVATGGAGSPGSQAGNITVADALSWSSGSTLTLNAFGAIAIDAPITVTGAGGVALLHNAASTTNLRFGARGSIDYGATDLGGTLSINGNAYKLIYNMAQLDAIDGRDDATGAAVTLFGPGLTGRYALATKLNAAGKTYTTGLIAGGGPDGAPRPTGFSGTLTGLGNSISNLTIAGGGNAFVGLVGVSSGTLRDIAIVDSDVSGWHDVGGLAGLNSGLIAQAFASGVVSGGNGAYSLGGIAGASIGTITDSGSSSKIIGGDGAKQLGGLVGYVGNAIVRSYATGAVSGGDSAFLVGGLTGVSFGTITASYATGAVSGEGAGAGYMGGLAGQNSGDIHQSYATGAVRGNQVLGGLVGLNTNAGTTISQSYATGLVHSTMAGPFLGGLAGFNQNGATVTNSYWDKQSTGRATSSGGAGATGLTTAQLQSGLLPTGFDATAWGQAAGFNPFLKHQTTVTNSIAGDRMIDGAFAASVNMLLAERNVVIGAGNILVDASLGWSTDRTLALNADAALTINAPINVTGGGGVALRYDAASATNLGFGTDGSIDFGATDLGGKLSINGDAYALIYTMAQLDAIDGREDVGGTGVAIFGAGLAGRYALATNLNAAGMTYGSGLIAGGDNLGGEPTAFSGTLTGLGHSISGLTIDGGDSEHIGLIGHLSGTIRDIGMIGGSVSGKGRVGGLIGASSGAIVNAYATGTVSGGDGVNMLGGLVGFNNGKIARSYATGAVDAANAAGNLGGLVGQNGVGAVIAQSYATGNVTGGDVLYAAGGLVGGNDGEISESYATGSLSGGDDAVRIGGLVGTSGVAGHITLSHASGDLTIGDYLYGVGGLVGENAGEISESHATGSVSGGDDSKFLGGLVGDNLETGTITRSYASGDITVDYGSYWIGGLAGNNDGAIAQSYAQSAIVGGEYVSDMGGLVGLNTATGTITDSHATGDVSGGDDSYELGGFVGINEGAIVTSYASGAVSGGDAAINLGGLVGINSTTGTITDSYATGDISGADSAEEIGGLAGANRGAITGSHATGAITAGPNSFFVGGLVGANAADGSISQSYATGTVGGVGLQFLGGLVGRNEGAIASSYATGDVSVGDGGLQQIAGLVGTHESGSITQSYATGNVRGGQGAQAIGGLVGAQTGGTISQSYATGAVGGGDGAMQLGGLVGFKFDGSITQSYATGSVISGQNGLHLGGFVGLNFAGDISESYSRGVVSGGAGTVDVGGFVGFRQSGTIATSYWDTQTSGWTSAAPGNGTGLTTAQFQSGALPIGFDPAVWGTGPGLYPYLDHFFPNGMQVVSGFAWRADGSAMASGANGAIRVSIAHDGTVAGSATTGANGYYYVVLPVGTLTSDAGFAAFTQNNAVTGAQDAVTYRAGGAGEANHGIDLTGGWRRDMAGGVSTLSALGAGYAAAIGATAPSGFMLNNRQIDADGGFLLDQALSVAGTLALSAAGNVTQSAAITALNLRLGGASARYTLTSAANMIDNLATAQIASLDVTSNRALTIASGLRDAAGVAAHGVTATNGIRIVTTGNLGIASGARITGDNPLLIAGRAFINDQGSDAVTATSGRWLIYSADPTGNRFGNLDSGNNAVWNTAAGGTVSGAGNRYVFAKQPTLTISARNGSKIYGEDGAAYVAGLYAISGFDPGVAGAYLADNAASALSGAPALTSAGSAATAVVGGSPYSITLGAGTLAATSGYALAYGGPGQLIVTPRALTITADALSRIYGDANPTTGSATGDNLVNGDTIGGVTLGTPATIASGIGSYDITGSAATGTGLGNYAITYATRTGGLTITPRALTITADALSRIYGDATPTTGSATGDNLVNGDTIGGVTLGTPATIASGIGSYDITGSAATGTGLGNYTITYTTRTGGLIITPRALTITADALSRIFGAPNPTLTYQIGGGGLVNGDLLNGELATPAAPTSAPGRYAITQGSLAASPNYILNYVPAVLTVRPPLVTSTENRAATQQRDALMNANATPSNPSSMRIATDTEGDVTIIVPETLTISCVRWQPCAPGDNAEVREQVTDPD